MNPDPLVLIVEDELPMRRLLGAALSLVPMRVVEAETLREATTLALANPPDVVVLDLGLPDGDGVAWIRSYREWSSIPVIVVSARGREDEKVVALDAGADDYLTKPFGVSELLARLRVALRHRAGNRTDPLVDAGGLRIDLARRLVWVEEREIHLTPTEYRLLAYLARHAGKVVTHRQILREVWGPNHGEHSHYVRVYMAELRKKIEPDPTRPRWIATEVGVGYRLREAARDP